MSSIKADGRAARAGTALPLQRLFSRPGLIVATALAAAVALAWAWLVGAGMAADGMGGMGAMPVDPWSGAYLGSAFLMWALMMVAMMLPSAAPMILLHASIDRAPTERRRLWHSLLFVLSYLVVWTGFSALAAVAQALLIDAGLVSTMTLALGPRAFAAALLVAAALYQLTPAKGACLDQCRSPVHFVMRYWSPGAAGALRLGLIHGLYCLGCCWGLMLLLFVGGVMNLAWVAALALIVFAEKVAPPAWRLSNLIAVLLLAAALALVVSP